jgi:V8-like Glu-specific endopeptidase
MLPSRDNPQESIPFLVTNYHILYDSKKDLIVKRGLIEFVEREGDKPVRGKRVRVEVEGEALLRYNDPQNDLAALPIAPVVNQLELSGRDIFFRSITSDLIPTPGVIENLAAVEEVTFIGYPSGLYDEHNVTPIVRRGITATPLWNDFLGQPSFLIDAGVFPGSSGSPVFLFNQGGYSGGGGFVIGSRLLFLGVLSESIVRMEQGNPVVFLGLGKVIKSQRVLMFLEELVNKLP